MALVADKLVDNWEVSHNQSFPKAGSYYQGTKHNFFDNYEEYRADIRKKSVSFEIEAKLHSCQSPYDWHLRYISIPLTLVFSTFCQLH